MRALLLVPVLLLASGCAGHARRGAHRAAALDRPGDAARPSILGLHHQEPRARTTADPLPAVTRADLGGALPAATPGTAGAGAYVPFAPGRAPVLGPWRLAGDGDVSMPLEGAWRMRVGLSAGGVPPEHLLPEPG